MVRGNHSALRPAARIAGWAAFAMFELLVVTLAVIVASVRCCAASGRAAPQSPGEWVALAIFALVMLLLGGAVGAAIACAVEALLRLAGQLIGRRKGSD